MLLVLFPLTTLGAAVVWFVVVRLTHKASVASIVVVVAFPVAVAIAGYPWEEVAVLAVLAALVVARHASNLRRLFRGEELALDPDADVDPDDPAYRTRTIRAYRTRTIRAYRPATTARSVSP